MSKGRPGEKSTSAEELYPKRFGGRNFEISIFENRDGVFA